MTNRILTTIVAVLLVVGCSEQNPNQPEVDHEVLTTVELTLHSATDTIRVVWQDSDAIGSTPPDRVDTLRLAQGVEYQGTLSVFDATVQPKSDITPAIKAEAAHHQFLYKATDSLVAVLPTDTDEYGKLVGLSYNLKASRAGKGSLSVTLYHYTDPAYKVSGMPGNSSDISVLFPLVVEMR